MLLSVKPGANTSKNAGAFGSFFKVNHAGAKVTKSSERYADPRAQLAYTGSLSSRTPYIDVHALLKLPTIDRKT